MKRDSTWRVLSTCLALEKQEASVTIIEKKQQLIWSQTSGIPVLVLTLNYYMTMATASYLSGNWGFPGGASGKETACQCRRWKRCGFDPWVRKIPWRRAWQPTPVFLPEESHGQRSLCVLQSQTGLKQLSTCDSDGNLYGTFIKPRAPRRVLCLYHLYHLSHKPQVVDS